MQETGDAGLAARSSLLSPKDVLKTLMNDEHFDGLRVKILNQLKQSEEIQKYTSSLVASSKVLNTPGAEDKGWKDLIEALRKEHDTSPYPPLFVKYVDNLQLQNWDSETSSHFTVAIFKISIGQLLLPVLIC